MLKNLEGLPTDHPMRELMNPLYHLSDHAQDNDQTSLLYPGHHDPSLNLSDNLHGFNPNANYMHNLSKAPMHPMFNIQDMISGGQLYDKNPMMSMPTHNEVPLSKPETKEDDDEEGSVSGSDDSPSKKRGKYKTYTDEEKARILTIAAKHGIEKTLDLFSEGEHKLTKRKLRSWLESQDKVKGVKGRKSNEPNRDNYLYEWYLAFQNEHNRPPTRKEATKKALEITDDPKFQASKGWLDKFSRKFKVEFTPLKIVPPKTFKKGPLEEDMVSTATTFGGSGLLAELENSPKNKKLKLDSLKAKKIQSAPIQEKEKSINPAEVKLNVPFKSPLSQTPHDVAQPGFHAPSQFKHHVQPVQPHLNSLPLSNDNGAHFNPLSAPKIPSEGSNMDQNKQQGYQMPFYPMDYNIYNPFNYQYPSMPNYPLNYPMNMPMNYPPNFAENLHRLQQAMKKDNDSKSEKTN